jgi:hypothetical protein
MDPAVAALLVEGAKFGLQAYFTNMKLAGKTEEEINALFAAEYAEFKQKRPENLPDV